MDVSMFLTLLLSFTALSGIITEVIKQFFKDKPGSSYNLIAVIVGLGVGIAGTYIYYYLTGMPFENSTLLIAVLMGISAALSSMVGYDKIKQLILQLNDK